MESRLGGTSQTPGTWQTIGESSARIRLKLFIYRLVKIGKNIYDIAKVSWIREKIEVRTWTECTQANLLQ